MSKTPPKTVKSTVRKPSAPTGSLGLMFQQHPHAIFMGLLGLLLIIFFHEAFFSGKVFNVPDSVTPIQYEQGYLEKARQEGVNAFWNPYIFAGMPTWGSSSPGHGMYLHTFLDPLKPMILLQIYGWAQAVINVLPLPPMFWDIFNFFLLGLFTYLFGLRKKFEPVTAFLVSVSVVFSLYSLNWIMGGHNTKITVFAWLPAILLLIDLLFEKKTVLRIALLVAVLHFTFNSGHVQMIFYNLMAVALYFLYKLYEGEKAVNTLLVAGITIGAAAFAFLMLSGPYFATWEYKDFSIRGAGSGGSGHGPAGGGLDYNYATNWSFSLPEVVTFFVPSFVGFGTPTYWGTMPFTESPIYLGVVISFLALLGIILQPKNRFVHFWMALGLIALLLSFGRNFGVLYDLFFNHMPFFNNFRIPSMVLYLMALCMGMLAGVGLSELVRRVKSKNKNTDPTVQRSLTKAVWLPVAGALVLFLGLIVLSGEVKSAIAEGMQAHQPQSWNYMQQVEQAAAQGQLSQVPAEYRSLTRDGIYKMAMNDALVALVFMVLCGALLWGFSRGKVPAGALYAGLLVLLVTDWWIVDYKPMNMAPAQVQQATLQKTDVVDFLQRDTGPFRILPVSAHGSDNYYVAFGIESIAGYHPAKMKFYDDIRNRIFAEFRFESAEQIDRMNWPLLSMLNTKYVVGPRGLALSAPWLRPTFQGQNEDVFENTALLPRAFFVGSYEVIPDDSVLFSRIGTVPGYQPDKVAYLSVQPDKAPAPVPDSVIARATATITARGINGMTIKTESPADAILKLSESYYPSGWTATIDGAPAEILRTDYAFRAIVVPAGAHTVTLDFEPRTYAAGLLLTTITNYLLIAVLLFYAGLWLRARLRARQATAPASDERVS